MSGRRIAILLVVVAGTLAGAGLAYSTGGPKAPFANEDRLYGGGTFGPGCFVPDGSVCIGDTRNISMDVHSRPDGKGAMGDLNYGNPSFTVGLHLRITCMAVHANKAVVVGIVTEAPTRPAFLGYWATFFFVDRGTPAAGERDLSSFASIGPPDPVGNPPGYPYVCPSPDTGAPAFGFTPSYLPLTGGDIVVQDATRGGGGEGDGGGD